MTGPYFYDVSNHREPGCNCNTLQTFWVTQLRRMRQRVRNVRFQQGGEKPHVTRQNKNFLRVRSTSQFGNFFGRHVHRTQQPQTFSLSECLKCKVYVAHPGYNQELKIQHSSGDSNKYWCFLAVNYAEFFTITAMYRMSWGASGTRNLQKVKNGFYTSSIMSVSYSVSLCSLSSLSQQYRTSRYFLGPHAVQY